MRAGLGYDVHKLTEGEELILGGCKIPFHKGLKGHSDADVLIHSIIDGMLGAASLGDIGDFFPETADQYKNISSLKLLNQANKIISENNFAVNNIDVTIVMEAPKIKQYKEEMVTNISSHISVHNSRINIKATTSEGLGFTGKGEGIVAQSIVTLRRIEKDR